MTQQQTASHWNGLAAISRIFLTLLIIGAGVYFIFSVRNQAGAAATSPAIFYSDLTSGPNTGGENNNGVIVTIYGQRFGTSQGNSTVTVGGGAVAQVLRWCSRCAANPTIDEISFVLGANAKTGSIVVTVAGQASNTNVTFTVRPGNIFYVALSGSDSNNGSFTSPFRTIPKCRNAMTAGDICYIENGMTQSTSDNSTYHTTLLLTSGGTMANPLAFVAYPNATVSIGNPSYSSGDSTGCGIRIDAGATAAVTISGGGGNWTAIGAGANSCGSSAIVAKGGGLRVVGMHLTCPDSDAQGGCLTTEGAFNTDPIKFLGSEVTGNGGQGAGGYTGKQQHGVYFTTDSNHVEAGWNYIHDNKSYRAIQFHSSPAGGNSGWNQFDLHVHDNIIFNDPSDAINFATVDPSEGVVEAYNNVIYHVGLHSASDGFGSSYCIFMPGTVNTGSHGSLSGNVHIYNNTFYDCGSYAGPYTPPENGVLGHDAGSAPNVKAQLDNNIIYQLSGENYIGPGDNSGTNLGSNNLFFGAGAAPSAFTASLNVDPLFVNRAGFDFHLQASSPAINAGITTGIATDSDGVIRPQGSAYDIGAFEFVSGSSGGPTDTTPPSVSLTAPANNATVTGTTTVSATASDNVGVTKVELYKDGSLFGTDTAGPYSFSWNTTTDSNGSHTLLVKAYDAAGNTNTASVNVTVSNGGGSGGGSAAGLSSIKTVFVILEENHNWSQITSSAAPYIWNTLVPMGAHANQYYNPPGNHPSEPNYIWLEAGSNLGVKSDNDPSSTHQSTVDHLVTYLNTKGISWKSYQEDIPGTGCPLTGVNNYRPKHNPMIFFDDVTGTNNPNFSYCISHIRPYTELASDLQNNTVAQYNFITPNMCNDMHDCSVSTGDTWLKNEVPKILNSQAYKNSGALFITWDEGEGGDGPIGMVAVSPFAKLNYSNTIHYTHSSLLRTIQEIFGATPLLRDAANATNLSDFFTFSGGPTDATPPSVSLTAPADNTTVTGTVAVSATASDNVGVVGVQFKVDGINIGSEVLSAPYTVSWNSATVSDGSHSLTASARDAAGNIGSASVIRVTVSNVGSPTDTTPPAVSLTAPANAATVSGTVLVSATASDNVGVTKVELYKDGALFGTDTSGPYSFSWNTTADSNGSHTLLVKAYDAAGNTNTANVTVTVNNGVPPPPTSGGSRGYVTTPGELAAIAAKAAAGTQPYKDAVLSVENYANTGSASVSASSPNPTFWPYGTISGSIGSCASPEDPAYIRYGAPLIEAKSETYRLTGNAQYAADVRTHILDLVDTTTWGGENYSGGNQCILNLTWFIPGFIHAADLIEGYSGWSAADKVSFQNWLASVVYRKTDWAEDVHANNWGASGAAASASIADYLTGSGIMMTDRSGVTINSADAYQQAKQRQLDRVNGNSYMTASNCPPDQGIRADGGQPEELARGSSGCDALWIVSLDPSYTYSMTGLQGLIQHAELLLRRGDHSLYDNLTSTGKGSLHKAVLFLLHNPNDVSKSVLWKMSSAGSELEFIYRYYRDPYAATQLGIGGNRVINPDGGNSRMDRFGTLTHGFAVGEDPGLPPTVPPPGSSSTNFPAISISIAPSAIILGQSATISWSSTNATSCVASGSWSGAKNVSGTATVTPAAAGVQTYTLVCTGSGGSATNSVSLSVSTTSPTDTTPPSVSLTAPANNATVTGTTTVSATASDNVGVTKVELYKDGSLFGTDTAGPYSFSWNTTTDSNGSHTLLVKAYDAAGNTNTASVNVTVSNGGTKDTTPPVISSVTASALTASSAAITWTTNEAADSQVEYGSSSAYGSMTNLNPALLQNHTVSLAGLAPNTVYHYRVKSSDAAGNLTTSGDFAFTTNTLPDTVPPGRSGGQPHGSLAAGTTTATISLVTDEAATCRYSLSANTAYVAMTNTFSQTGTTMHSQVISGLTDNSTNNFYVKCADAAGNANSDNFLITFVIPPPAPPASGGPPLRASGQPAGTLPAGTSQVTLSLTTDEAATCRYSGAAGTDYTAMTGNFDSTGGAVHTTVVSGLTNGNSYSYYVRCLDTTGNANPDDFVISFQVASPLPPPSGGGGSGSSGGNGTTGSATPGVTAHPGKLIKYPNDPTVYVMENGTKRPIPSYAIYQDEFGSEPIATISPSQTYPTGSTISFGSGALLKTPGDPTVYLILDDGSKYAFKSADEFYRFGYRFDMVQQTTSAELDRHATAGIAALSYHATGQFIKYPGYPTVYRIENRTKRGVPSPAVLLSYTDFSHVLEIDPSFQYPDGPILGFPDGMLIKGGDPTVYLLENGLRRPFSSAASFLAQGFSFSQIVQVPDSDLNLQGTGAAF